MFLIDDILLSPLHGVLWVAREVDKAAQEELANESGTIKADLSELYLMLETGRITEEEFDAREKVMLDRLDAISERLVTGEVEEQDIEDEEQDKEDE
ncbi:MAG: gas vesicle protein GvpG [Deltaproteobacteria bacterium]|uniref:gas vesicle protein GvpG n=1 Tax=Candidatus Deferrimicrobium sp. TaxID=3060586 RepID=UPI0027203E12|nr:gas vesicle protein GvpG [Candidatus Deferrimicrobium sp.]MCR4308485.1 gas vesicle protein GvpG [Deltaproteobacteria bacterium]MDO8737896.1 gas vesicle protein GvpG [Candidatus Deferrimicrobium sp.]